MPDRLGRIGIIAAVIITALGVAVAVSLETTGPRPSAEPPATSARPSRPADGLAAQTFRDFSVLPGEPAEPIGLSHQSRLWTIGGRWWGALVDPASRETRIFELAVDGSTWHDTGVLVDERPGAVADVLWQGAHLYVATIVPGRAVANGPRVSRFSQAPDGPFVLDPDFPVRVADRGARGVSLARDSTGRLWATFVREGEVLVAHSTVDEAVWSAPVRLPSQLALASADDVAALVATDDDRLGIVWSDGPAKLVQFAGRRDSDPPEQWAPGEAALEDLPLSANAISVVAVHAGRIAVGVETEVMNESAAGAAAAETLVLVRDPDATWRRTVLSRVEDRLGPPTVVADARTGRLHAFSASPRHGGAIYLKSTDTERLEFPAGRGTVALSDPSDPTIAVPTSTKQPVDLEAGVVVLGLDVETGTYWHALIHGPGSGTGPSPSPGASPSAGASPSPSASVGTVPATYIDDTFDPWPVGEPIRNGWQMRDGDPADALTAAADASGAGHHARLVTASDAGLRACKSFTAVGAGTLVVRTRVQLDALGATDAVIASLRDRSGESATVRFGQGGTFAYYAGPTKVRSTVAFRAKTWYRSVVTLRPAAGTYDWVVTSDSGDVLLRVPRIPLRDPAATMVSSVCLQTSEGKAGLGLRFDDVLVSR